ncbi:hypothetical protein GW17_00020973 [Ensete ventricosum]|nr:hypothetical protein GW17_00020973 [Ensete ventricosum]
MVETVEGYKDLQIPSGTQPGETLKFTNMGVPNLRRPSVRGDHHFVVRVEIPKNIRASQTGTGIASISLQAPVPAWMPHHKADPSTVAAYGAFAVTGILYLICRISGILSVPQKNFLTPQRSEKEE